MAQQRIHFKGRGKTERPVCTQCGEDLKVSLEYIERGKPPKRYGLHCKKCKVQIFD